MGRNGCCPCFSSKTHSPSSSKKVQKVYASTSADTSSADNSGNLSKREEVPSSKLVPLPRELTYPYHAVGVDDQVNCVIQLLEWENETNVAVAVILHGLGGTGKTTLAHAVLARLDIEGWSCFTVVPSDTVGSSMRNFEAGQREIQDKQSFIYIDNVMVPGEDLQKLLTSSKSCKKLRLLLTARDEMVADVLSDRGIHTHVYPVKPLLSEDAMELLLRKMGVADTIQTPQINEILKVCDGVPLVVERVGTYICESQDKDEAYRRVIEWSKDGNPFSSAEEYSIEKNGLIFDLDKLPASAKEAFLDICSFFNGWDWEKVSCIMGEDELNSLRKSALLFKKDECQNKVMVPHIVLRICRNLSKGKRFKSVHDLSKVLEGNDLDIAGIKGIWLKDNTSEPFLISAKKLDLMHDSLRVLALGDMAIVVEVDGQYCRQRFKQLLYFQAGLIPCIPFHPTTLRELRILDCRLPHDNNDLQLSKISLKLKVLNLNGDRYDHPFEIESVFWRLQGLKTLKLAEFKKLKNLPEDLSSLTQLEELDVSGCRNLVQLPKHLGNLNVLNKLNLRSCESLQELPDSFGKLRSLKYLDLHFCVTLEHLPQEFGSLSSLEELDLGYCSSLKDLPSSFGKLSSLKALNLLQCRCLNRLPDNIGNLSALVKIEFEGWRLLKIPPSFQRLNYLLVSVNMADCSYLRDLPEEDCSYLRDLPEEVCSYLKFVKDLSFESCRFLTNLPKNFVELASLRTLDLSSCTRLVNLPEGFGQLKSLAQLNLSSCLSLLQLSPDFHCLASLQILKMDWCENLEEKSMDSVGKIQTLDLVSIMGSKGLVKRWAEIEDEKGGESWHFAIRPRFEAIYIERDEPEGMTCTEIRQKNKEWKNVENMLNKAASKLFTGNCLLTDNRGESSSLFTVALGTDLLVMYGHHNDSWQLLEEVVKHEHPLPFQMIYVGNYFGELSKSFADRIMASASEESDAALLFYKVLEVTTGESDRTSSYFLVTKVVADEEDCKHFSTWTDITDSCVDFFLSKSTLYSHLKKLIETPQENNVKLLRALFHTAESRSTSSIFLRNYTEHMGIDGLQGKTVLLLISVMDQHPFESLTEIYSKVKTNDAMEILSIPIPVEVRGRSLKQGRKSVAGLPDSDLAGFESILRNVPWPVLRNPWLLKTEVYYFFQREWSELNPAILVVVEPNGRISNKNALPLVETWGAEVYPFTEEKMKQLEQLDQEPPEEQLSEYILAICTKRCKGTPKEEREGMLYSNVRNRQGRRGDL